MTNFLDKKVQARVELVLPDHWLSTPKRVELALDPHARVTAPVAITIPETYQFPYPRIAITAEVTYDGQMLGQVTEATVELREES